MPASSAAAPGAAEIKDDQVAALTVIEEWIGKEEIRDIDFTPAVLQGFHLVLLAGWKNCEAIVRSRCVEMFVKAARLAEFDPAGGSASTAFVQQHLPSAAAPA